MDKKEVLKIFKEHCSGSGYGFTFDKLPDKFKKAEEVILEAVKHDAFALQYADKKLKGNKEIVLAAVKNKGQALDYADDSLKKDKKIVLAAVKQNGSALDYADKSFKKDKEIVLIAVKQYGSALKYADKKLRANKKIVLAAVKQSGLALRYIDQKLEEDKEVVLAAAKQNGSALEIILNEHADEKFLQDKEVVLEAVKTCGAALQHADDSLKKDKEIVDAAVKQDESAIQYADMSLKKDSKITKEIYIKTEPGGRVAFGKLDKTQEELFYKNYSKKEDIDESLLDLANSGMIEECEGVINSGKDGEEGNEGIIVFEKDRLIEIPKKNNKYEEGVYLTFLHLSKVSIQFEFEIKDKKEFDPKQFKEISVPIRLPNIIEHERYDHPDFNIVIDYLYKDKPIEEYQSHGYELTDRGYDDQIIFFEVKDGKTKILYSSYNGEGKFL